MRKCRIQRENLILARHAEEAAIDKYSSIKGRKRIPSRKLRMVVVRIDSKGKITESKPCSHCVEVMRSYGIRKVTYSTKEGVFITESLDDIVTQQSVGYRSVEQAMDILDEMVVL